MYMSMTRLLENKLLEKMVFDLTKRWFELRRKLSEADPRHCSASADILWCSAMRVQQSAPSGWRGSTSQASLVSSPGNSKEMLLLLYPLARYLIIALFANKAQHCSCGWMFKTPIYIRFDRATDLNMLYGLCRVSKTSLYR